MFIATWMVIAASKLARGKGGRVASPCTKRTLPERPTHPDIAVAASQKLGVRSIPVTLQPWASGGVGARPAEPAAEVEHVRLAAELHAPRELERRLAAADV